MTQGFDGGRAPEISCEPFEALSPGSIPMPQLPPDDSKPAVSPFLPVNLVPGFIFRVDMEGEEWIARCGGVLESEDSAAKVQPELIRLHETILAARRTRVRLELHEVT